jgi:hypothetical protein
MEDTVYLAVAYIGMLVGLAIWTWTVLSRSKNLEARLAAVEASLNNSEE